MERCMAMVNIIGPRPTIGLKESTKPMLGREEERIITVIRNLKLESGKVGFLSKVQQPASKNPKAYLFHD